jgi:predicted nuclease of predicted toxin-antitoxin system
VPKLLLDEHFSPDLAEALRKRGVDAVAVAASALATLRDEEIFARAAELGRVIVTFNNPDFVAEIAAFAAANPNRQVPGVLFIPGKRIRASEISRLAAVIEDVARRIDRGEADPRYGLWVDLG